MTKKTKTKKTHTHTHPHPRPHPHKHTHYTSGENTIIRNAIAVSYVKKKETKTKTKTEAKTRTLQDWVQRSRKNNHKNRDKKTHTHTHTRRKKRGEGETRPTSQNQITRGGDAEGGLSPDADPSWPRGGAISAPSSGWLNTNTVNPTSTKARASIQTRKLVLLRSTDVKGVLEPISSFYDTGCTSWPKQKKRA